MAVKRFNSKIDVWIKIILALVIIGEVLAFGTAAAEAEDPLATTGIILVGIVAVAFVVWLILATYYTVDRGNLKVVAGPFRRNISIDQITAVEETGSWLSSPALSLDRMRIRYGNNRQIIISPADKNGFLKAIGHVLSRKTETHNG